MSTEPKQASQWAGLVVWGWTLVALGVLIVCASALYLWNENVWIGTVGAAGADSPSSIPLYLNALMGVIVATIGGVFVRRGRAD